MKVSIASLAGVASLLSLLHVQVTNAATETVVYSFCSQKHCSDGANAYADLTNVNGKLYGTTESSGKFGEGTVFSFNPRTGEEKRLYSFGTNVNDGNGSGGTLLNLDESLYGLTVLGGSYNAGTVFSLERNSKTETVLHSFGSNGDGMTPRSSSLVEVNGVLYGTTPWGGTYNFGTVFSIDPKSGAETIIHSFQSNGMDGFMPEAGLTNVGGTLYGTTVSGGPLGEFGCGTLYSVNPRNGVETVLYSFRGDLDGCGPWGRLLHDKGILYGTTMSATATVFSFNPQTSTETVLHIFAGGADGNQPMGGLVKLNGTLHGTTYGGGGDGCGGDGCGTVFAVDPESGAEAVLHSFQDNGSDGKWPYAGLVDTNGVLYGTTALGGTQDAGTIFRIRP